jgi:hypothetical protein
MGRVPDLVRFCAMHELKMIPVSDFAGADWNVITKDYSVRSARRFHEAWAVGLIYDLLTPGAVPIH